MSLVRVPIKGWKKCVFEAAAFETEPEFHAAKLLDLDKSVTWWLRNDPVVLRIPTPAGFLEPDFLYAVQLGTSKGMRVLEVKGEHLWNGPGSSARIKAAGAAAWVKAIYEAAVEPRWEFHEVLGQDVIRSATLGAMLDQAVEKFQVEKSSAP